MKYRLLLLILLISIGSRVSAQYYNTGQDPAFIKWLQIKTGRFTIIYPQSYGEEGLKFAKSLDRSFSGLSTLFPERKVRIPVIIHNYTTFSNGYVAWAPRRMEIYPTPEMDGIPSDPVDQLTLHELTHVYQMTSLKKGFSGFMSIVAGQQFTGAVSALLPSWFLEGDAVFAESLLSPSGRGKTPAFLKQMKAIALDKTKMYSYDKMLSGSYKVFTPDQYSYGYQMIAWSFTRYGPRLWNKTLDFTSKYPFTLNPVNISLRTNARISKSKLFSETFDSLKIFWQKEEKKINPVSYIALNPSKKKEYINYYSPVILGKDSVIAIKTSLAAPAEFVLLLNSGRSEKRIFVPGSMNNYIISGAANRIVWVEERPDPRWDNRTFSVINIRDINLKTSWQLSTRSRYLAASLSHDGRYITASENTIGNENFLIIMDAADGNILSRIPAPENAFLQRSQWSQSGEQITAISSTADGEGIISWSLKNKEWKTLISPGRNDLQSGYLRNDSLFFVSSSSGTDNVYILTPEKKLLKATNSRFGAYDAVPAGEKLVFTDYSENGYNICMTNINEAIDYLVYNTKDPSFLISRFDTIKIKSPDQSITEYKPKPYRKIGHIFGIHSWMPFYADITKIQSDPSSVRPGFTIMSQNQLSTVTSSVGYEYAADRTNQIHAKVTWQGLPPVIESQLDYGSNAGIAKLKNDVADPMTIQPGWSFTNTVSLPLVFSTGRYSQFLRFSITDEYDNNYIYLKEKGTYDYGQSLISGRLIFYNYRIMALRDIYPKWGQVLDLDYTYAPFDDNIYGTRNTLKTAFYFPGFLRNHGIRIRYEAEIQEPQKLLYYNNASLPRGYDNIISEKVSFLSADYVMPIIYPDLNIPGILFLKRIRSAFFYDYATGTNNHYLDLKQTRNISETFRSFGAELMSDFYILRIPFLVSAGVHATWKSVNEPPLFKAVFNVDVFGMKIGRRR